MQDEVDRLIADWRRERPDLDLAPMQVLSRVTRLAKQLDHARSAAFAEHGIVSWEFDVLAALRRSGEPYQLSPGRLLQETMVTSGTMTNRIDRLAARGLVVRGPDPHDGRGVAVTLTPAGLTAVDGALVDLLTAERAILGVLSDEDAASLADLLRALAQELERPGPAA
ncbi:MarR family winged helix-turn-helix transcriptional regulator [Raineyella fluvialis]|uniref:MarR family transcriptional regulator n=1 Tax=Raineyella fluvialis TaxID=2662261 RepID=A0A5Q2FAP6_9ACTN|nr:MarR family winged helix-turn-helix transcriptional regulator [Raineyella fluvialis]QGF24060.1 MarR family transcriptional regulator [Raineyella fluvialis]